MASDAKTTKAKRAIRDRKIKKSRAAKTRKVIKERRENGNVLP